MRKISFSLSIIVLSLLAGCASSAAKNTAEGDCTSVSPGVTYADGLQNLAVKGTASQSSTYHWNWDATPDLAIDGNTDGNYMGHSVSHTLEEQNSWWEVDLGGAYPIEKVVIWNRTDGGWGRRLTNFRVIVLNEDKIPVIEHTYCRSNKSFSPAMIVDMHNKYSGRYVKIMLNGKNYLQLAEVEVFAKK